MWLGRERVSRVETMHDVWIGGWEVCTKAWN